MNMVMESVRKIYLIVFLVFALTSCVTQKEYEQKLRSWVGSTESELIKRLGTPS